jgi:hypothetical protein
MGKSPRASAPRHCRRCPDLPLLSQCTHTLAGREYVVGIWKLHFITALLNQSQLKKRKEKAGPQGIPSFFAHKKLNAAGMHEYYYYFAY